MKRIRQHIALIFTLLLLGGMMNEAWADVTYIILTKEFSVKNSDNSTYKWTNIRLEALRCTSSGTTVYLPDAFRSPLAKNFQYWKTPTVTANTKLYDDTGTNPKVLQTTYNIYTAIADELTENSSVPDGVTTIYVTYDYDEANTILKLDGAHKYNISLNTGNNLRFFCFNKNRGNRPAAAKVTTVSAEDLANSDFTQNVNGFDGTKSVHYQFYFDGQDPYNITIRTAYNGNETYDEKLEVEGTRYKKPYAGSTIFAKLSNNNNNDGTANMWLAPDAHRHYKSTADATVYDSWEGFYRSNMNPIFNAVALLPKGTSYFFVASKLNQNNIIYQPNKNGYYASLSDDGKNPRMIFKALSSAVSMEPYPIYTYTFKVKTPFGNYVDAEIEWSDYYKNTAITDMVPESLKRKYTTITGFYADEAHNTAVTTFAEAQANCSTDGDKYIIYVDYSVNSLPFETLPTDGSYKDARWYTMRMNGDKENKNIVKYDSNKFITGGGSDSDIHQGENSLEAMVAFIGDPYELRILNRKASETASANSYIGCASDATDATDFSSTSSTTDKIGWEIVDDVTAGTMVLRELGTATAATPMYFGWHYGAANNPIYYTSTSNRIKVVALDKKNYVYHIVRSDGSIAIKATESQDVGTRLQYGNIPEIIRSPFINPTLGATLTFSYTKEGTYNKTYASLSPSTEGYDIYVKYDLTNLNNTYKAYINGITSFNVRLNGQYIYYDSSSGTIKSSSAVTSDNIYDWNLGGSDPYAMTIQNGGNSNKYVTVADWADGTISWSESAPTSKYIIKATSNTGVYEVMAATGDDIDAATTYYNIGRPDANTVKMYSNSTYAHGYSQLRFQLTPSTAHDVTYHLIDKSNSELLSVVARQSSDDAPLFPDDYRSPLVATYHYWTTSACNVAIGATIGAVTKIYVTYDTGTGYDLQNKKIMYLLKYEMGTAFYPENGSDGLETNLITPIYPYCNGDCNFFVYGQAQFDLQQQGAASTRTRWAWFLESANNDPYHVKICSRQTETYNGDQARAYFHTYKPSDYSSVVTTLTWPGISGVQGTEYMVLGSEGQFRLVTTATVDDGTTTERRTVNSFEQYWKTWDTIRKKVLGDGSAVASQTDPNTVPATPATAVATAAGKNNRTYLSDIMGWHSYEQWAYAKRWNGYNISGKTSKGWETIEHWYQTVQMGEGYFDLVPITIDPALILLDQHGWEIMRKPLPSSADDPELENKHAALRVYDSPMVKEYHFWSNASKRSGFHQYYNLGRRISTSDGNYSSTSLGSLPPIDATNVKDAKGNVYDQYVTYVVKDEYVKSLGEPFLIQQGSNYVSTSDGSTITKTAVPSPGGMSQYIIDHIANLTAEGSLNTELWYLKPNADIDTEMGYGDAAHDWTNDYTVTDFSASGFDPYNIQVSSVHTNSMYFKTNATGATLNEGILEGTYSEEPTITMGSENANATCSWYDSRALSITDKTFMAVQDENGNMQLMPRFDQIRRMKDFTTLTTASDDAATYTTLYRPLVYNYHIIDNSGAESLRYQSGGDLTPQTPEWFKSQLAKDFKYYTGISGSTGSGEITEESSLAGAGLTTTGSTGNDVYVRYSYDEDADFDKVLQGKWLTMKVVGMDAVYDSGDIKQGNSKPSPVDGDDTIWQWKFLKTPQSDPDPYAVSLYNRSTSEGTETTVNGKTKFALLNWYDGNGVDPNAYTLAVAGTGAYTYDFVNGASMTTTTAATTATESGFLSTSCSYNNTDAKIVLNDDVEHTFTYHIYTNGTNGENDVKYGIEAVSATQDNATVVDNSYTPTLPEEIRSPLLNSDQFLYYGAVADMGDSDKELDYLYGLYTDDVYVRYTAYNLLTTEYKVPNVKTTVDSKVARGEDSNDASLDINGELIYNIIWYDDKMMKKGDGDAISSDASHVLDGADAYVWQFEGNDPYAIKIKHKSANKYAVGTDALAETATSTFMLLPSNEWEYGVLQVTGDDAGKKLTTVGNALTADANTTPTRFIIFGLSTHKVIYHLVIANIGNSETIPYLDGNTLNESYAISGSTMRDLTTDSGVTYQLGSTINGKNYCVDDGHITLGDPLAVPDALYRPNCKYFFYVGGIYDDEACNTANKSLNTIYKGHQITQMGTEPDLVGKTVVINIVYAFDDGLPTNNGSNFVTNTNGTQWYTFETSDATPYLAHYTYKDAKLTGVEGRVGHYTNDFLWSPVGDPYGFKMYNRYVYKNGGETTKVMTTASAPAADADLIMAVDASPNQPVYELLPSTTDGYFKVQTLTTQGGTPYYIDNTSGTIQLKSSTTSEWTFSLSDALLEPYYLGAGNVGGLTETGKAAYEAAENLMAKQAVVYNDANIVHFTPGYYRIFSEPNSLNITIPRYLSGYTHKTELTGDNDLTHAAIPMHFYEKEGVTTTFEVLGSGFTLSAATRGFIPISAPEYDPASIFYISGNGPYTMQTQGLYVDGAVMASSAGSNSNFHVTDIGGAVVVLHDGNATIASRYYLNYDQTDANHIYDVKYTNNIGIADATKWCMEPANKKGLWIETHSGGEEAVLTDLWYYSSYCVPFDMLIQKKNENDGDGEGVHSSNAYTCVESESPWSADGLHPKPIGKYNTGDYVGNDYFVPAGTPVLFSTKRATSYIKATIPTTTPSTPITTIFSAEYLEQIISDTYDDNKRVYVFGPKMEGDFELNTSTGAITAVLPSLGNTNVGFHINANPNKEAGLTKASWTRNNYYVLHNKIYYRATGGSSARGVEFVPVVFSEEPKTEIDGVTEYTTGTPYPGGVYNLQGRCVATEEMVKDGTWRQHLAPGIYIMNGRSIIVK